MSARIEHLAIAAPRWVGDLVMATPVLEAALAAEHIGRVTILVRKPLARLLDDGPLAPHVRPFEGSAGELAALEALAPEAVLLLTNSLGSAWRALRAGVRLRAGSALSGRRWLLTHAVLPPTRDGRRHPIPTAHLLRDAAGLLGIYPQDLHPRLDVTAEQRDRQRAQLAGLGLASGERYLVCAPGAAFGAAKLWPPEHFARALDLLAAEHGLRGVVSGGPGEEALIEAVVAGSESRPLSLAGVPRDLTSLKALVRDAELLLVGDSGPRWVAAAFDVPCVSVMGPNVPELTATSLEHARIVRLEHLECSPCARRVCPLGHHRCMRELGPERVVAAAQELLAAREQVAAG